MSLKVQLHIQKNLKNHNFAKVFLELENFKGKSLENLKVENYAWKLGLMKNALFLVMSKFLYWARNKNWSNTDIHQSLLLIWNCKFKNCPLTDFLDLKE